ncbi:hypothetical protein EVAR_16389_1 [Eumeta japonica]|uniref:Uncharacterized protein n=1 Tax=Eumeta variegata TaxID=151549 RepID=A0A4C1VUA1_EUMVA|nr:hypothetical protein EVAR_16389_1 [Eumeta japonica]
MPLRESLVPSGDPSASRFMPDIVTDEAPRSCANELQLENESTRYSVRYYTLTEYKRKVTASVVAFHPISETSDDHSPSITPTSPPLICLPLDFF